MDIIVKKRFSVNKLLTFEIKKKPIYNKTLYSVIIYIQSVMYLLMFLMEQLYYQVHIIPVSSLHLQIKHFQLTDFFIILLTVSILHFSSCIISWFKH